jgi:2-hydroxychromene-2-carboxylate isomerase
MKWTSDPFLKNFRRSTQITMKLEFHFDFGSPNTYYCHRVIPQIEQRTGVKFDYVPILLGGVFKLTNNQAPMLAFAGIKNKSEYSTIETARFIKKHQLDKFVFNPNFPVNTLHIMRGAVYAKAHGFAQEYNETMYRCMWEKGLDMSNPETIAAALADAGLPAEEIVAGSGQASNKQTLVDNTANSVERGSFGSPTFFIDEEIYFGKEKLVEIEEEIINRRRG